MKLHELIGLVLFVHGLCCMFLGLCLATGGFKS